MFPMLSYRKLKRRRQRRRGGERKNRNGCLAKGLIECKLSRQLELAGQRRKLKCGGKMRNFRMMEVREREKKKRGEGEREQCESKESPSPSGRQEEEIGAWEGHGAKEMVKREGLAGPVLRFGCHVLNHEPTGSLACFSGYSGSEHRGLRGSEGRSSLPILAFLEPNSIQRTSASRSRLLNALNKPNRSSREAESHVQ